MCSKEKRGCPAEDGAMSEVHTVDAVLFGLLVFSGILGNLLVIHVVRKLFVVYLVKEWSGQF